MPMPGRAHTLIARPVLAWLLIAVAALVAAGVVERLERHRFEVERLELLQLEAVRAAIEVESLSLNGPLMGAMRMFGLLDPDIQLDIQGAVAANQPALLDRFERVGRALGAQGVFVVGRDGVIRSSWDETGKPSTGLDVRFRPYFQAALKGHTNVYAAVSVARGDRVLYYAAPVCRGDEPDRCDAGAVVARTGLTELDRLLASRGDAALLVSPHGWVFASSRDEWQGRWTEMPDAQRLETLRALNRYGRLDDRTLAALPFAMRAGVQRLDGQPYALAFSAADWNDPEGAWTVILLRRLPDAALLSAQPPVLGTLLVGLLLGWLVLRLLRMRALREVANARLREYADRQQASADFRNALLALANRMQHCDSLEALARQVLGEARELFGALQGALYAVSQEDARTLELAGSSACAVPPPSSIGFGEGLLGQCALEKTLQLIETPPEGSWTLRSGLGETRPAALLIAPLLIQNRLIGVLELALPHPPAPETLGRLEELSFALANALEILRRQLALQNLAGTPPGRPSA